MFQSSITQKRVLLTVLLLAAFCIACNSGNGSERSAAKTDQATNAPAHPYDTTLAKGKVIDSVLCKTQPTNSYALYLPVGYTHKKSFPCIYFFDAHARGSLPLKTYKELADKYGFVLVGSNVSKNGIPWSVTNDIVKVLFNDTRDKINIDTNRVYTSGFSGGSRVASSIAIFNGGIAGVIGCAAGFPGIDRTIQNQFDYIGLVGEYDFNLMEMEHLDGVLEQNGFRHQLIVSEGVHGWAPANEFHTALLWLQVDAMKRNLIPKTDTTLALALRADLEKRAKAAKTANDLTREHQLLAGIVTLLDGVVDITAFKKQFTALDTCTAYKNENASFSKQQRIETNLQHELAQQYTTQDEKWWINKVSELNNLAAYAKTPREAGMNKRLINYLGLVSYLNITHSLKIGDLSDAEIYLRLFKLTDPKNPDVPYLSAIFFAKKGLPQKAFESLHESVDMGYNDLNQLVNEPAFAEMAKDPEFIKIIEKTKSN